MVELSQLSAGQIIRVRRIEDQPAEWCVGIVMLASPNGKSIAVRLDGVIRAGAGILLGISMFSVDYERERVTAVMAPDSDEYEIEIWAGVGPPPGAPL